MTATHPRLRARRVEVRRAEGRRRLRMLLAAVGLLAGLVGLWGLTRSPLLDVDRVAVDGVVGPPAAAVEQAASVPRGTPLLDLDTSAVEGRVEALPWVLDASVSRGWPGTVEVAVERRVPVAVLAHAGGRALVDAEARVVALLDGSGAVVGGAPEAADDLVELRADGPVEPGAVLEAAVPAAAAAAAMPADLRPWVDAVTVAADGTVVLDLVGASGAVARLAEPPLVADAFAALRSVLASVELACVTGIDLSRPDQTVLSNDPSCLDGAGAGVDAAGGGAG